MSEGYIIGGGSSGGGTLVVTGVAGDTVTVSKDGKTRTRVFDSSGKATFRGLASGTWTLIMTNGVQTATRTVEITADYSVSIAYFAATINITYPAGSTCTATDGATTLTAPDTTGTWACVVPNTGTWTINCTDGSQTATNTVTISTDGESKSLTLSYTLYLYSNGNECSSITGGWGFSRGNIDEGHATMTSGSTALNFSLDGGWASGYGYCAVGTQSSTIDLSGYKTLRFHFSTLSGSGEIYVRGQAVQGGNVIATADWSGAYITVDISSVTGNCSVGVQFQLGGNKAIHWDISMDECVLLS